MILSQQKAGTQLQKSQLHETRFRYYIKYEMEKRCFKRGSDDDSVSGQACRRQVLLL